ncbi:MAG: tRNA (guanosine(37)-N1)-methyltransferase TrmD [Gammaproteobacteria bacterium]|nr:tRNA (guanosine(37)-N1)-methyltransferase TrmD [Gammaproteobacteria bacterium]MBL6819589.1 tRNA (guanosine(37)-N1)-methyltransferase TrmD [Gammaproteobacteria bacterium]
MNQFNIITIYPKFFESFFEHGLIKKAIGIRAISINVIDLRLYTKDKHQRIDFKTYGGGPGMVVQYQPVRDCLDANKIGKCYLLSPQGKTLSQKKLIDISKEEAVTFLCGRYEGLDQRIIDNLVDEEISIGDYVLSGGEMPAATIIEGITRLLPGVADSIDSIINDSFYNGILDHPHYTKPEQIDNKAVPKVLLSGNHQDIASWRRKQSLGVTLLRRPELLKNVKLTKEDDRLLQEFIADSKQEENE